MSETQRRDPLISTPKNSASTIIPIAPPERTRASRRTCRGLRNETPIITASAGMRNTPWRSTKWKLSSPSRSATAGLAANDIIRPMPIKGEKAARNSGRWSRTSPRPVRVQLG
jgi:hypothetical protein